MGGGTFDGTEWWNKPWEGEVVEVEKCPKCKDDKEYCMCLPEGFTCDICARFNYCKGLGVIREESQSRCDWHPVRFKISTTAYMEQKKLSNYFKAHADFATDEFKKMEAKAERFRQALNCPECRGRGKISYEMHNSMATGWMPCPKCSDIRKEARRKDLENSESGTCPHGYVDWDMCPDCRH